ncbi:MerR family transcriptional regulator [Agrobacterium genomosp. 3 str. RTP8]|uniref:MerR family transcriptional regulator n=1 Tax=Agrobacterium tomkonis TaxID=1183410 RepID=UPI001CD9DA19|nr:MerR family transcriptional regulator [Agrobacterium tomkonis RTP8]
MRHQSAAKSKNTLKISDLSRLTGVPISTLRVWGERGLLSPDFTPKGYRVYNESHVKQAMDIKRLRTLQGSSLTAIKAQLPDEEHDGNVPKPVQDRANQQIGTRLRALRLAGKHTIRDVSVKTGISASVLASMERTSLGLQIPELKALAGFYGLTLTSLMAEELTEDHYEVVTHSGGGQILPTLGKGLRIEQLATGRDMMDCQRWFIEPGVNSHGAYNHDGEELVYVLLGEIEITIEETRVHVLRQGDSIYFKSSWKHAWYNSGRTTAVLLWVNTPPSF